MKLSKTAIWKSLFVMAIVAGIIFLAFPKKKEAPPEKKVPECEILKIENASVNLKLRKAGALTVMVFEGEKQIYTKQLTAIPPTEKIQLPKKKGNFKLILIFDGEIISELYEIE